MEVQPVVQPIERKSFYMSVWYISALIAFLTLSLFLTLLYFTNTKTVFLVIDGEAKQVKTMRSTVQTLLQEQKVTVSSNDFISMPLDQQLKHGDTVEIEYASLFTVNVDGESRQLYSTKPDIFGALTENGIALGIFDRVSPSLSEPLEDGMIIDVTRIIKDWIQINEKIDYKVVRKADASLMKGTEKIVQDGKSGTQLKEEERVYENGVLVATKIVNTQELKPTHKVVVYGTKKLARLTAQSPVIQQLTREGVTFDVRKIIRNGELTAYAAGVEHTGKTKDHPEYAITYTGVRATEGKTVAVDPRVIPLGWWIYIEGYGFRRTEDTGSAVKGNRIDIYFEDNHFANRFGLKRGYTVYIIGPNNPFK
jgi:3D (Asp-Asp-Asp) domain-containing protein